MTMYKYHLLLYYTAPPDSYTLSLHDALPIYPDRQRPLLDPGPRPRVPGRRVPRRDHPRQREAEDRRSEEHTSELQSRPQLVCRLLLEKKKNNKNLYDIKF